jgi:hypothetical protein
MRKLMLGLAAAGTLGLAVSVIPAQAGTFTGLTAPEVESNKIDARCWHRRRRSGWRCTHRHRHWHHRWRSHRHYYYGPRFYAPGFYYRRYWW